MKPESLSSAGRMRGQAVPPATIRTIVEAALRAPSGDNCQPWRFVWDGEALRVLFQEDRARALLDVESRASWAALGALLENARLAALKCGLEAEPTFFPDADTALRVIFRRAGPRIDPLVHAIPARATNRRPFRREPLPNALRSALAACAEKKGEVRIDIRDDAGAVERISKATAAFDPLLFSNEGLHRYLYEWLRWPGSAARDGMPLASLELALWERPGFRFLRRSWAARWASSVGLTEMFASRAERLYRRSAGFVLVSVPSFDPAAFVAGGGALERLWLTVTAAGWQAQPVTGLLFSTLRLRFSDGGLLAPAERQRVARAANALSDFFPAFNQRVPVMLFRVGRGAAPSVRTPRLAVEDVLSLEVPS